MLPSTSTSSTEFGNTLTVAVSVAPAPPGTSEKARRIAALRAQSKALLEEAHRRRIAACQME